MSPIASMCTGIVLGALLIAGFFTFMFDRLFAVWIGL